MHKILNKINELNWQIVYDFFYKLVFSKYIFLIAFLWWLFESTFFFIIPDILVTFVVLFSFIKWFKVLILTIFWALVGGSIMYLFWKYNINLTLEFLNSIPYISNEMLEYAKNTLETKWLYWMVLWPSDGISYKIYATFAWNQNFNYIEFLIYTIPARLTRLLFSFIIIWLISNLINKYFKRYYLYFLSIFLLIWTFIYWFYFYTIVELY